MATAPYKAKHFIYDLTNKFPVLVYELIAQLNIYQMFYVHTPHEIYVPVFLTNSPTRIFRFFHRRRAKKNVKNVFIKKVKTDIAKNQR